MLFGGIMMESIKNIEDYKEACDVQEAMWQAIKNTLGVEDE